MNKVRMEYFYLISFYLVIASVCFFVGGLLNKQYFYCLLSVGFALFAVVVYRQTDVKVYYREQMKYFEDKLKQKG